MTNLTKEETEAERSSGWFKVTQLVVALHWSQGRLLGDPWSCAPGSSVLQGAMCPRPLPTPRSGPRPRQEPVLSQVCKTAALARGGHWVWPRGEDRARFCWVGSGAGRSRSALTAASGQGRPPLLFITHAQPPPGHRHQPPPAPRPARTPQETERQLPERPGCRGPRAQPGLGPGRTRPDSPAPQAPLPAPLGQGWPPAPAGSMDQGAQPPRSPRPREPGPRSRAPVVTRTPARGLGRGLLPPQVPSRAESRSQALGLSRRDGLGRQGCVRAPT